MIMSALEARGPEELDDYVLQPDISLMFATARIPCSRMRRALRQDGLER